MNPRIGRIQWQVGRRFEIRFWRWVFIALIQRMLGDLVGEGVGDELGEWFSGFCYGGRGDIVVICGCRAWLSRVEKGLGRSFGSSSRSEGLRGGIAGVGVGWVWGIGDGSER